MTVAGTQFYRHGAPYRFLSANMYFAMHLGAPARAGGDRARLTRELDQLVSLGVRNIRCLASSEGPDTDGILTSERTTPYRVLPSMMPSPGQYNEDLLDGLDFVMHALRARNLTATLVLSNMWPWSGGFAQLVSWTDDSEIPYMPPAPWGDWDTYQQFAVRFYGEPVATAAFEHHVDFLLHRVNKLTQVAYASDPTILSWELANEPRPMGEVEAYSAWVRASASRIKAAAPRTLITIGSEGQTPFDSSYTGLNFEADHAPEDIDYATMHVWPQNWGWYDPMAMQPEATYAYAINRTLSYMRDHVDAARRLGKPLILEEFGLARDANLHAAATPTTMRDRFFADVFSEVAAGAEAEPETHPLVAAGFWAWGGEGRPRKPRDPAHEPLDPFHLWQPGDALLGDPPHEAAGW